MFYSRLRFDDLMSAGDFVLTTPLLRRLCQTLFGTPHRLSSDWRCACLSHLFQTLFSTALNTGGLRPVQFRDNRTSLDRYRSQS
jgi:hypothetical protein